MCGEMDSIPTAQKEGREFESAGGSGFFEL